MTAPVWAHALAATFWRMAGGEDETFPRALRPAIARAFPLTPVALPVLRVADVEMWLDEQGIPCRLGVIDRRLRACLVAHAGSGIVFLDRDDVTAQQRFSLAHELAHYLRDYWEPRRHAMDRFGEGVLEVFDGTREPRPEERVQALLAQVPIGFHVHLLERDAAGAMDNPEIDVAEKNADCLAFELLAPERYVMADLTGVSPENVRATAESLLATTFGFPMEVARRYAATFGPIDVPVSSFLHQLRVVR